MQQALWIGLGGFVGTLGRFLAVQVTAALLPSVPGAGTFLVNVLGSFGMGCLLGLGQERLGANLYGFLATGILGGFTTYSAFAGDSLGLLRSGSYAAACIQVCGTIVLCIVSAFSGFSLLKN